MENAESLLSLAEHLSEMPGGDGPLLTESLASMRARLAIEKAIADNSDDEPAQIDAVAEAQGYFMGYGRAVDIVNSYVNGTIDVQEAVRLIAEPIEHAYTTANGGRLFVSAERCARSQRVYWEPSRALELWGPEEDLDELQSRVTDPDAPSTEGQLWNLYYTILHAARKTPWRDEGAQQKLVNLVTALKARTDPDLPANMTTALKRDSIYADGHLWSDTIMFSISTRESWNDFPGCGAGWYPCEVNAWTNVNAFVARCTAQHIRNFSDFGMWSLGSALDEKIDVEPYSWAPAPSKLVKAESLFQVARVWIRLAGQSIFEAVPTDVVKAEGANWDRWQRRLEEEAARGQYSPAVTAMAKECAEIMSGISGRARTP